MLPSGAPTARVAVRRHRERGQYDRHTIRAILDEALLCHVGVVSAAGHPVVLPFVHAWAGDHLYLHGARANHVLREAAAGSEVCVTVTLLDGLVLARSVMHHSANYRSVVVLGRAREVTGPEEKLTALRLIVEHVAPGRSADARPPSDEELRATMVVSVPLTEASAKVRTGPPLDDEADLSLPVWAGVLPVGMATGTPVAADGLAPGLPVPDYVSAYGRPGRRPPQESP
jgi:nitroimidazol reductase NimA-like FMN-containing flavoprotein (pyridoxamine 5'-phosphate oxidase superfamily)